MVLEVLAVYRAKKIVQDQIRRQGHKVSEYTAAEIKTMAEMWLTMHKEELVAEAKRMVASSPELTKMLESTIRRAAKINHFDCANLMRKITSNRPIYFGLIEQLIYEYVRNKYDHRLRKGKHRRPNLRRSVRRATARTSEGRRRAQQRGVKFGRKLKLTAHQKQAS
jgi:hypothetical protein